MNLKTYGVIKYYKQEKKETAVKTTVKPSHYIISSLQPHVAIMLKNIFPGIPLSKIDNFYFPNVPATCHDLTWFMQRFPLSGDRETMQQLNSGKKEYYEIQKKTEFILSEKYAPDPKNFEVKKPFTARPYQIKGAEFILHIKKTLLCDDMGLGKSLTATLCFFNKNTLPGMIVCQTHLPHQWKAETIEKFTNLKAYIIPVGPIHPLPAADIYIVPYSRLAKWSSILASVVKSAVFDEVQELRRVESLKYDAAREISRKIEYSFGLSGTPIYNYGIEIFNIINCLNEGALGRQEDFCREWGWKIIKEPISLGTYLREKNLMLRRTTKEVGRELPQINTILKTVAYDEDAIKESEELASQLAISYLNATSFEEKGNLGRQFDLRLRQLTGIAKAKSVAALVRIILKNNKPVLLSGWHRDVYDIWIKELDEFNPVLYTGTENPSVKEESKRKFVSGETNLMLISNRSGIGLDGLQHRCSDVVIGELDFSPKVPAQIIARVNRDGRNTDERVTVYYPVCEYGSDPPIIEILGLKTEQSHGIVDPLEDIVSNYTDESRIKKMAENYLNNKTQKSREE